MAASELKLLLIAVILLVNWQGKLVKSQYYDNYDDYNYGDCDFDCDFYNSECSEECHHEKFPTQTIEQKLGPKVRHCCSGHSYIFNDHCPSRPDTNGKLACAAPQKSVSVMSYPLECPAHCTRKWSPDLHFSSNFTFDQHTGQLGINMEQAAFKNAYVHDYCLSYSCKDMAGWEMTAQVCICFNQSYVTEFSEKAPKSLPRCCQNSKLTEVKGEMETVLTCPATRGEDFFEARTCERKFQVFPYFNVSQDESFVTAWKYPNDKNPVILDVEAEDYCIGPTFDHVAEPLKNKIFKCSEPPCKDRAPCIRTCCRPNQMYDGKGDCLDRDKFSIDEQFNLNKSQLASIPFFTSGNLDKAGVGERMCKESDKDRKPLLNPRKRCNDQYELKFNATSNQVTLIFPHEELTFEQTEYCLNFEAGQIMTAEVCREVKSRHKFKFYPYVLLLSSLFLCATLIVYTAFPKLLNHYTRVMRHFTFTMMISFVNLAINQLVSLVDSNPIMCKVFGFAEQYFFLASFALMTAMSCEMWMQISGSPSGEKRYRIQMLCGYGLPLIVTVLTGIVEAFAEQCATFRPRIGEEQCFFTSIHAKGIWFFLPIGLLLAFNAVMFVLTVYTICKIDKKKRQLNLRSGERSDGMEKFLMFLKLFIGMGFIWTFEIIAGLCGDTMGEEIWYVTDSLNMLQGFYIFLIFVCKRNVINVILGRPARGGLTHTAGRSTGGAGGNMAMRLLTKNGTKRAEIISSHGPSTNMSDVPLSTSEQP